MKKPGFLQKINRLLGLLSVLFFIYALLVLPVLQAKMVRFEGLTPLEEMMITSMGVGLLFFMLFYLLTLLQNIRYVRHSEKINFFSLLLIVALVICVLLVFADWALLSDIHKQYLHELSQPEWALVYPILSVQFLMTLLFVFLHFTGYFVHQQIPDVAQDNNTFLLVQYVGLLSGLFGLVNQSLGFLFPGKTNFLVHTVIGSLVLLFPYVVVVFYWTGTKLKESRRVWFDEKQRMDLGKSAMFAVVLDLLVMSIIYAANINNLQGVVHQVWFPLHLFSVIFFFSWGNLFFSKRG